MKLKKIEFIPGVGINILGTNSRTLFDENGVPVVHEKRERFAVGLGDFAVDPKNPTPEEQTKFKNKIKNALADMAGIKEADLIAELAAEREKSRKLEIDLADTIRQRDAIQATILTEQRENGGVR